MNRNYRSAILGLAVAIAITTAMDATGYSVFSALPLMPLTAFLWWLQKLPRQEIGLTLGRPQHHALAVAYPAIVLGSIGLIALLAGAVDTSNTDWNKTLLNIALMSSTGILMALITEEGFFRGWLWAALKRAGRTDMQVLVWTSVAFAAWHIPAISLDTGFDVPRNEIPVYLINATLLGVIWGMLRLLSGSILVSSVSHAVWNGVDYPLYGFGEKVGALGISETHVFGPEVGWLGVLMNSLFAAALFLVVRSRNAATR